MASAQCNGCVRFASTVASGYQAGATPYLGRTLHRLDRTSLRLAHSLNHLFGTDEQRWRRIERERLRSFEIDDELELGRCLYRKVGRLLSTQDPVDISRCSLDRVDGVGAIRHQAAGF